MRSALATYHDAIYLFDSANPVRWWSAALLAHAALERLLKSALISAGCTVAKPIKGEKNNVWWHDLANLASELAARCPNFPYKQLKDKLAIFDAYFEECRYPAKLDRVQGLGQEDRKIFDDAFSTINNFAHSIT